MLSNGMRYRVRFDCSGLFCWQAFCIGKRLCRAQRHARRHTGVTWRCERPSRREAEEGISAANSTMGRSHAPYPCQPACRRKATAQLKDGLLEIRIPKSAEARLQEIPVSV